MLISLQPGVIRVSIPRLSCLAAVLRQCPQGSELMVAGYFNADLEQPKGVERDEEIASDLTDAGLEDMSSHFLP